MIQARLPHRILRRFVTEWAHAFHWKWIKSQPRAILPVVIDRTHVRKRKAVYYLSSHEKSPPVSLLPARDPCFFCSRMQPKDGAFQHTLTEKARTSKETCHHKTVFAFRCLPFPAGPSDARWRRTNCQTNITRNMAPPNAFHTPKTHVFPCGANRESPVPGWENAFAWERFV